MPEYLVEAVGERPKSPSERATWHEVVRRVEAYRQGWGVSDEKRILGPKPSNLKQRRDRDNARRGLKAVKTRLAGGEVDELERSHHRKVHVMRRRGSDFEQLILGAGVNVPVRCSPT
jgi:hypothetical protein